MHWVCGTHKSTYSPHFLRFYSTTSIPPTTFRWCSSRSKNQARAGGEWWWKWGRILHWSSHTGCTQQWPLRGTRDERSTPPGGRHSFLISVHIPRQNLTQRHHSSRPKYSETETSKLKENHVKAVQGMQSFSICALSSHIWTLLRHICTLLRHNDGVSRQNGKSENESRSKWNTSVLVV